METVYVFEYCPDTGEWTAGKCPARPDCEGTHSGFFVKDSDVPAAIIGLVKTIDRAWCGMASGDSDVMDRLASGLKGAIGYGFLENKF
jgi:hypothetical protein